MKLSQMAEDTCKLRSGQKKKFTKNIGFRMISLYTATLTCTDGNKNTCLARIGTSGGNSLTKPMVYNDRTSRQLQRTGLKPEVLRMVYNDRTSPSTTTETGLKID